METITLQVDSQIAKAYREAEPEKKQKIATIVNEWLRTIIQEKSLEQIIEEMQEQAQANGLTEEILNKILENE